MFGIGVDKVMIPELKFKPYKDQEMQWNFTIEEIFNIVKEYPDRLYGLYGGHSDSVKSFM